MKQTNERLCALAQKGDAAALDSLIDNNKSFIGKVANDLFRSMNPKFLNGNFNISRNK